VRSLLYDHDNTDYDEITSLTMNPFGLDELLQDDDDGEGDDDEQECEQ
jgi:hypothetical protein